MAATIISDQLLRSYVEPGRHTPEEVDAIVRIARYGVPAGRSLAQRPWIPVSVPGAVIDRFGPDVVLGVPRAVLDDHALRKVARACPQVWLDGRWYPADIEGFHLLLAIRLTVADPDGIDAHVAALLDVPAEDARFTGGGDGRPCTLIRLTWRAPR